MSIPYGRKIINMLDSTSTKLQKEIEKYDEELNSEKLFELDDEDRDLWMHSEFIELRDAMWDIANKIETLKPKL